MKKILIFYLPLTHLFLRYPGIRVSGFRVSGTRSASTHCTHTIFVQLSEFPITSKRRSDFSFIPSFKTWWTVLLGFDTQNSFFSSVSFSSKSSWTSITTILSISNISSACGVGNPSTILGTDWINIGSDRAIEFARIAQKPTWAITRNTRAETRDLLFYSGIVFDTSWNISPSSVFLKYGGEKGH